MQKPLKFIFRCSLLFVIFYFLSGCATAPNTGGLPVYSLNGTSYLPLAKLCQQSGISWDYDTLTRTVTLTKGVHKIELMAGETLVLVDGSPQHLKQRVDFYQGEVVVPYKFKEQVLDPLFPGAAAEKAGAIPLKIKKVVIDSGHGGYDPGTIGKSGIKEKYVNLDIAKRLEKLLRNAGVKVVMTRSSDKFISLQQRVDIANNSGADIFISVHSNANRVRSLRGFEAYYISFGTDDISRALSAAKNADLNIERSCFYRETTELKATLWDLIYSSNRAESVRIAEDICRAADRQLEAKILGVKGAGYYVLKGCHMPAVLIEVGFLSNDTEEHLLKNTYYRQQIAEAVAQGVINYSREITIAEAAN